MGVIRKVYRLYCPYCPTVHSYKLQIFTLTIHFYAFLYFAESHYA